MPLDTPASPDGDPSSSTANRRLAYACLGEGALAGVACLLAWLFGLPLWESLNPPGKQLQAVVIGVLAMGPMVVFLLWMLRSAWPPIAQLRQQAGQMVGRLVGEASPAMILAIAVFAGVGEELLFRGALQPLLGGWLTPLLGELAPWGGVVAASLLFGLAHPMSRMYIVVATIGGLYLGVLAQLTGEVLSATVAHAAYDIVALYWLRTVPSND